LSLCVGEKKIFEANPSLFEVKAPPKYSEKFGTQLARPPSATSAAAGQSPSVPTPEKKEAIYIQGFGSSTSVRPHSASNAAAATPEKKDPPAYVSTFGSTPVRPTPADANQPPKKETIYVDTFGNLKPKPAGGNAAGGSNVKH